jgi:tetratricopeptide (TPR) repeat protein
MRMRILVTRLGCGAMLAMLYVGTALGHENTLACDAAAAGKPAIEAARNELKQKPKSVGTRTDLSDLLVGVGCYDEAVHVLEDGLKLIPNERTFQARLRTARSFIGEREYLEKVPALGTETSAATVLRLELRCRQFAELPACETALASKPNDATLWAAKGDALLKDKRSQDALVAFNRAAQVSAAYPQTSEIDLTSKISAARALLAAQSPPVIAPVKPAPERVASVQPQPTRKYSNIEPAGRSN